MQIMIGLVVGLLVGWYISTFDDATAAYYANIIRPFSQIFIRMIRMLIAPLLFGTLVAGIAGAGHFKDVGRMGLRAIIYFEVVTTLALFIGLAAVNILKPGVGVVLPETSGAPAVRRPWHKRGTRSCCTWCRPRSSRRCRPATSCRSSCSASCSRSDSAWSARRAGR